MSFSTNLMVICSLYNVAQVLSFDEVVLSRLQNNALVKYHTNPTLQKQLMKIEDHGTFYSVRGRVKLSAVANTAECGDLKPLYAKSGYASLSETPNGQLLGYCAQSSRCGAVLPLDLYYSRQYKQELVSWDANEKEQRLPIGFAQYKKRRTLCYAWPV